MTHTLVGANLAACPPARRIRLAGPALIIGANLPDVDVVSYLGGSDFALGFRRGWTHGWPALIVLPFLLWLALRFWERRRPVSKTTADSSAPRLLALCYLATLTHPCLDWLNTYGMRWRMPLEGTWSYGDSVFIIDPWLWLVLGGAWLLRKRPGAARRAVAALVASALWIAALLGLHTLTVGKVQTELATTIGVGSDSDSDSDELLVGPKPANPLVWDVVVRSGGRYRVARYRWPRGEISVDRELDDARAHPRWDEIEAAAANQIPGFLSWVRFPWLEMGETLRGETEVHLMDARYVRRRTTGFGGTVVRIPSDPSR